MLWWRGGALTYEYIFLFDYLHHNGSIIDIAVLDMRTVLRGWCAAVCNMCVERELSLFRLL